MGRPFRRACRTRQFPLKTRRFPLWESPLMGFGHTKWQWAPLPLNTLTELHKEPEKKAKSSSRCDTNDLHGNLSLHFVWRPPRIRRAFLADLRTIPLTG